MMPRSCLLALAVAAALGCSTAPRTAAKPAGATKLFTMQSNFWVNLHHFLYVTSRARRGLDGTRAVVTRSLADTAGFGTLSPALRDGWNEGLAYYLRAIAQRDILFDSGLVVVNDSLSHVHGESIGGAHLDAELADALTRAAPAYRALWWPRHDAANRQWMGAAQRLLAEHGDSAAAWETRAFRTPWQTTPVLVDVTAYANWAGAYTTAGPSHVTVASLDTEDVGTSVFETLFHEVLHTMDDTLFVRFRDAAKAQGKQMRRDPTHSFIFYTAGEVTRRLFPGHVPFAESGGLWQRSQDLSAMRPLLLRHWQRWLDGQISFDEAIRLIAADL